MHNYFAGILTGIFACTLIVVFGSSEGIGAAPSNADFLGIYNATPTEMVLRDGYGSAFLVDNAGRVIATSTH